MNESQLLEQLAATDAYASELPLPAAAWSRDASLAEIERRIRMQTQTTSPEKQTPPRRRGWLAAAVAFGVALVLGVALSLIAPGDEGTPAVGDLATEAPEATVDTTEASTTSAAALTPDVLADRLFTAYAGSDPAAWIALLATDSPAFDINDWFFVEDYDGDGVTTFADWQQFQIAMHRVTDYRREWDCEVVSADTARCEVIAGDVFYALGGTQRPPTTVLQTFEAGLWIAGETDEQGKTTDWYTQIDRAEIGREQAVTEYEDWVVENHPDKYPLVFDGPAGEEMVDWVLLPSAIPVHEELLPEYLASVRADLLPAATTGTITVAASEWGGLEGHQVLAAARPLDLEATRSVWPPPGAENDSPLRMPQFVGSVSWGNVDGDPISGERVLRDAKPFAWFQGSEDALEVGAAQLAPGTYTIAFLTPGFGGPIVNWVDDIMPFASHTCLVEVEVTAGETSRIEITAIPSAVDADELPLCPQL